MAAYNFQKRFVPLIESGRKCSTIRARRRNGYLPCAGDALRLYEGMRTKRCRLIREVLVQDVTPIIINVRLACADVILNGQRLTAAEVNALAKSDGFDSVSEFAAFFEYAYGDSLQAYLIRWAP